MDREIGRALKGGPFIMEKEVGGFVAVAKEEVIRTGGSGLAAVRDALIR